MKTRISRTKLQLLVECQRCFWMDVKANIRRPQPYPYTLSAAVDGLLKKEFDLFREKGMPHPLMSEYKIEAKLFSDIEKLSIYRNAFRGIEYTHPKYGLTIFGAVDDIFVFPQSKLAVVDYKTTGSKEITIYKDYQLQMDIYTYLLKNNGYEVFDKAYFIFFQVDKTKGFNAKLPFKGVIKEVIPNLSVAESLIARAKDILSYNCAPLSNNNCKYCSWVTRVNNEL